MYDDTIKLGYIPGVFKVSLMSLDRRTNNKMFFILNIRYIKYNFGLLTIKNEIFRIRRHQYCHDNCIHIFNFDPYVVSRILRFTI